MENIALLIQLLTALVGQADKIAKLLNGARAEGRDVSEAELKILFQDDDLARQRLEELMTQKEGG